MIKRALAALLTVPPLFFAMGLPTEAKALSESGYMIVDESGHKVCPPGQQVRIYSAQTGGIAKLTHYWSAADSHYGHKVWDPISLSTNHTFTLHSNVYWRVVAKGARPVIHRAEAICTSSRELDSKG